MFGNRSYSRYEGLELSTALEKDHLLPGEPLLCTVTLKNNSSHAIRVKQLDHTSLFFSFWPKGKGGKTENTTFVTPVFSTLLDTGAEISLQPHASMSRPFLFTTLTMQRGDFVLSAYHQQPVADGQKKTFARSVAYSVAGETAFAHRTVDGLLSRSDAIRLAKEAAAMPVAPADALMIIDESGFRKWWVNVGATAASAPASAPSTAMKSYYIDPYRAVNWREAQPFTAEDRRSGTRELPKDSKVAQRLLQRTHP